MRPAYFSKASAIAIACAISGVGTGALAQTAPDSRPGAAAQAETGGLVDIVVTARRTEERLQDVPLAITALTGAQLARSGVRNLRDISYQTAGLTISSTASESLTQPIIRGLVNLNGGSGDPNVATFLDGIYLSNPSAVSIGLIDLERVEIVKGPVSALYGRNAFAGAINYVTRKPGDTFEGKIAATYGNDGQKLVNGAVGAPLIDGVLGIRLAGGYEEFDGSYRDAVNGLRAGGFKKRDAQGTFKFTPTERISLTGALYYGDDFFAGPALVYAVDNCGPLSPGSAALGESTFTQYCGRFKPLPLEVAPISPKAGASGNNREVYSGNLRFEYDADIATVSLLGGYNKVTRRGFIDFTGRRNGLKFAITPATPAPSTVNAVELFGSDGNNEDRSLELRIASKQDKPFRWAFGGYYYDADFTQSTLIGIDGSVLPAGRNFAGTAALFRTANGEPSSTNLTLVNGSDRQYSGFVSADWDIVGGLTVSGEYRYVHQKKSQDILRNAFVANTVRPFGAARSATDNYDDYRVTAKYKFSDNVMTYGSVGTGTKSFGFNQRATFIPSEITFDVETSTAYEIGLKSNTANRRFQLNLAAFWIDTKGLQVSAPSQDPKNTGLITSNFGATRSKGFEIEATAVPTTGVRVTFGLGYADPKFRNGARDFASAGACTVIASCASRVRTTTDVNGVTRSFVLLDGLRVPRASQFLISTALDLDGKFSEALGWFARADYRLESSYAQNPNNFYTIGDRTLINLRAGLDYQHVTLTGYVENLTKNRTPENAFPNTRLNDFVANPVAYLPLGRRYGLTVGYTF